MLKFYKIFPYILTYTNNIGEHSNGQAQGPVVKIRPEKEDDVGLLMHECLHVQQWYMSLGMHGLLYKFSLRYRQWSEVQAYRIQLEYSPYDDYQRRKDLYATWLSLPEPEGYGLTLSKEEALKLLS